MARREYNKRRREEKERGMDFIFTSPQMPEQWVHLHWLILWSIWNSVDQTNNQLQKPSRGISLRIAPSSWRWENILFLNIWYHLQQSLITSLFSTQPPKRPRRTGKGGSSQCKQEQLYQICNKDQCDLWKCRPFSNVCTFWFGFERKIYLKFF